MHRWHNGLVALLLFAGCAMTERQQIKPPTPPEEYVIPPTDDPRFSQPVAYPKGSLNQDMIQKSGDDKAAFPAQGGPTTGAGSRSGRGAGLGPGGY
jgi:hypothetical protein